MFQPEFYLCSVYGKQVSNQATFSWETNRGMRQMDSQVEEQRAQGQEEEELSVLRKDICSVYYEAQIPSRLLDLCRQARSVYSWRAVHMKDSVFRHELFG